MLHFVSNQLDLAICDSIQMHLVLCLLLFLYEFIRLFLNHRRLVFPSLTNTDNVKSMFHSQPASHREREREYSILSPSGMHAHNE
mmetsp:Transcript_30206/g.46251  ORF Transcript_30206/g.46251 Transcript_30206/m.46251 type:complete len:85 (-) Transcript_30206:1628-1882(-)